MLTDVLSSLVPIKKSILIWFQNWRYDFLSVFVTLFLIPLGYAAYKIILKQVKDWVVFFVEGILYWGNRAIKRSLAGALTLKRYCRLQLSRDTKYMFVPSSIDTKLDIDKVFIPVALDMQGSGEYNHGDILEVGNRIRVIGDPGSGKSSLIKKMFREECRKAIAMPSKALLPIIFELKNLSIPKYVKDKDLGEWFFDYIKEEIKKTEVYKMEECFDNYSQNSGLLVLLDGLDEIPSVQYLKVQKTITGLSNRLAQLSENNVIVLTMRTQLHDQIKGQFRDSFGPALFIKPFSPTAIYHFLTRWPFKSNANRNVSRIYQELTDRPSLREMCSNPLVLSMYVAEDEARGHQIVPETRTEFYSKVVQELIINRRLVQRGQVPAKTKLREQREHILGTLAFEHMLDNTQPINILKWSEAIRITKQVLNCDETQAEDEFLELAKETGIISEEQPKQTLRFIHLTFCEFLSALEAIQGQTEGFEKLIDKQKYFQKDLGPYGKSRLVEVIPFACGLMRRIQRNEAITEVYELGDGKLTARCFLETKLYEHDCWEELIEKESNSLLNEDKWDEQWLRDLYLFNVVVRDSQQCANLLPDKIKPFNLNEFFQNLLEKQKYSLGMLLNAYAAQDAAAAFRLADICGLSLARAFPSIVIKYCDQPPFLALVQEQIANNKDSEVWSCLLVEAALRSPLIAFMLKYEDINVEIKKKADCVPAKQRWHRGGTQENYFTHLVTLAANTNVEEISPTLTSLNSLKNLPPPGEITWTQKRWGILGLSGLTGYFIGYQFDYAILEGIFVVLLTPLYYFFIRAFFLVLLYKNVLYGWAIRIEVVPNSNFLHSTIMLAETGRDLPMWFLFRIVVGQKVFKLFSDYFKERTLIMKTEK